MIFEKQVKRYCCENISLIENYDKAINDNTQTWDCHHRWEVDKNLSKQDLIDADLYYHRPANELIFLTQFDHISLHKKGKPAWNKGVSPTEESRKKMSESAKKRLPSSEESKKKQSDAIKDRKWVHNRIEEKMIHKEDLQSYIDKGYKLGRK